MSDHPLPSGYADTDIAIVGMACRFPGASSVRAFWENIRDGVDSAVWLDDEELRRNGVTDEELSDPGYVRACYPVEDMEGFDAGFFGFSPREASVMDPQQRHFLELAWNAMEDAGTLRIASAGRSESSQGAVRVFT
jgi:acyl transferase domain-containing protein